MEFWNESTDCCSWQGVMCGWLNGHVIGLDLSYSELQGTIQTNSSLFHLHQLQKLNLAFNHVRFSRISSNQIPLSISNLAKLTHLFLSNNNLNGQILDSISNMSQLAFLDLSGNKLAGPIPWYAIGLSRLAYLDLKNNSLNGTIPSWLFTLPSLVSIELRDNKLQGQIPGSVYEPANLTHLSLSSNNSSGIVELDKLLKLKYQSYLDLSHNGLLLSINNSVNSTMPKFYTIGLASCNLSVFPNFLRVQAELLSLDLSNNKIGGEDLKWKLPWQTLQFIDLHSNLLHGPLPIPPITTIAFFISNNKLIGEIFPLICSLNSLNVLDLSNNNFSGIIPHCFGNFSNSLSMMNLGMNSFHGTFTAVQQVTC
ncbi:hypothetical protein ACSBR1_011601 [Camellia fascicularis]